MSIKIKIEHRGKYYSIPFNKPYLTGKEKIYLSQVLKSLRFSGDGYFGKKCQELLKKQLKAKAVFLTNSGTAALEMAASMANLKPGDEVIMPSFTFTSTANAFVLRGAKIVFVDVDPKTMNINANLIEAAITKKTKVIVPVHYGGVGCEMKKVMAIAKKHKLLVIEDAAQGLGASYKNKALGTFGQFGCLSFHETKNVTSGEGGALIINDPEFIKRAEIIREKGTNRSAFYRGQVDKYTWVDVGSSYLLSELDSAFLYAQLQELSKINKLRLKIWQYYFKELLPLTKNGLIELVSLPKEAALNGHLFYLKTKSLKERTELISYLKARNILSVFHYVPLHSAPAGKKFGRFSGQDRFTSKDSDCLLRLPLFATLTKAELKQVVRSIKEFYGQN